MSEVKTRFAPSPTGRMHVGNLRTALYAYLHIGLLLQHHVVANQLRKLDFSICTQSKERANQRIKFAKN